MNSELTVIMPCLNESAEEIDATLRSLFAAADSRLREVIFIDDASTVPVEIDPVLWDRVHLVKHLHRRGVDACRDEGVALAETSHVLLLDAHMRFKPADDWLTRFFKAFKEHPTDTLFCTTCIGLGYEGIMRMEEAKTRYQGAYLSLAAKEVLRTAEGEAKEGRSIIEGKWLPKEQWVSATEPYEIACVMGANYALAKRWYHRVHGMQGLTMWGSSEPFLSMKSWLAGGSCVCLPDIEIGHVFRGNSPFTTETWRMLYNKIWMMSVLLPQDVSQKLLDFLPQDADMDKAFQVLEKNKFAALQERQYFDSIRKRDIHWMIDRFRIELPTT